MRKILAAVVALLIPLSAQGHTTSELDQWYSEWLSTPQTSVEMLEELRDMKARHPCFPEACLAATVETNPARANTTVAAPSTGMGSNVEQWRTLVAAYFPADQVDRALRVMACESGGNPNAYNPSGASGLMQVLASWADNFGYTPAQLFDPAVNLHVASILYYDGGWRHWVCKG